MATVPPSGDGAVYIPPVENIPPQGWYYDIICDAMDLGIQEDDYGEKPKVAIWVQLHWRGKSGEPYEVRRKYTKSLHPRAELRRMLEILLRRPLTAEEQEQGIRLDRLIGTQVRLYLAHSGRGPERDYVVPYILELLPAGSGDPVLQIEPTIRRAYRRRIQCQESDLRSALASDWPWPASGPHSSVEKTPSDVGTTAVPEPASDGTATKD